MGRERTREDQRFFFLQKCILNTNKCGCRATSALRYQWSRIAVRHSCGQSSHSLDGGFVEKFSPRGIRMLVPRCRSCPCRCEKAFKHCVPPPSTRTSCTVRTHVSLAIQMHKNCNQMNRIKARGLLSRDCASPCAGTTYELE